MTDEDAVEVPEPIDVKNHIVKEKSNDLRNIANNFVRAICRCCKVVHFVHPDVVRNGDFYCEYNPKCIEEKAKADAEASAVDSGDAGGEPEANGDSAPPSDNDVLPTETSPAEPTADVPQTTHWDEEAEPKEAGVDDVQHEAGNPQEHSGNDTAAHGEIETP